MSYTPTSIIRRAGQVVNPSLGRAAAMVLDNAGWHVAKALRLPDNLTLLHLPAYSPELNPVERLWASLRSHQLANRVYADYDELLRETDRAWMTLDEATIRSVCACPWIERAIQT